MLEKGKIDVHQFSGLTFLFTVGSSILIAPSGLAVAARQDAWIAAALALAVGLLFVLLYNAITVRYPDRTLVQICRESLGLWAGNAVALLYFFYFFLLSALVLRNIGDFMVAQVLPNTPIQYIHILFLTVIIMGIRNGLEPLARTGEIFLPWVVFFFLMMVVLLPPKFVPDHVLPVLGQGWKPVVQASLPAIGTPYMEHILLLMLFPCVTNKAKGRKAFLLGTFLGGAVLVIVSLMSILVLGAELTSKQLYPSYALAKKISIGTFLERLEVFMAGIWFITIYFKLAVCFYASTMTFAELFGLKEAKPLYFPFGMMLIVLSIIAYPDIAYFITYAAKTDFPYSIPYSILFPLLILAAGAIRGMVRKSPSA